MRAGDGTGPVIVIANRMGETIRDLPGQYGFYQPVWSPDGSKVMALDEQPGPSNQPGPAVIVILDVAGESPPVELAAPPDVANNLPDVAASWQRIAP
jgi:hypothetical protein